MRVVHSNVAISSEILCGSSGGATPVLQAPAALLRILGLPFVPNRAIEEKFILDVLQNYTPYSLAFKLAAEGKELDENAVERSTALKRIMGWVRLHP